MSGLLRLAVWRSLQQSTSFVLGQGCPTALLRCSSDWPAALPRNLPAYLPAHLPDAPACQCCLAQGAEDFRRLKEQEREAQRPGQGTGKKRHRGIAFGSGGGRQAVRQAVRRAGEQTGADGWACDCIICWVLW